MLEKSKFAKHSPANLSHYTYNYGDDMVSFEKLSLATYIPKVDS